MSESISTDEYLLKQATRAVNEVIHRYVHRKVSPEHLTSSDLATRIYTLVCGLASLAEIVSEQDEISAELHRAAQSLEEVAHTWLEARK